jgi:hypothetical protein
VEELKKANLEDLKFRGFEGVKLRLEEGICLSWCFELLADCWYCRSWE